MDTLTSALVALVRAAFLGRAGLTLENAALRQQLTVYHGLDHVPGIETEIGSSGSSSDDSGRDGIAR